MKKALRQKGTYLVSETKGDVPCVLQIEAEEVA